MKDANHRISRIGPPAEFGFPALTPAYSLLPTFPLPTHYSLLPTFPLPLPLFLLPHSDDGSCCRPNDRVPLSSEALVLVQIQDVNNKKPHFPNCTRYSPMVYENEPRGTHVITVR